MDSPYPLQETPLRLPTGRIVTIYNVVVFHRRDGGGGLSVFYGSSLPETDGVARTEEASEVAAVYAAFATSEGLARITAAVCSTRAAIEMREPPQAMMHFQRDADGTWKQRADA